MCVIGNIISYKNRGKYYLDRKYILKGGGKKYKIQLKDIVDNEIEFKEVYEDNERKILLNNKKYRDYNKCIVIILNEKDKFAEISSLAVKGYKCIDLEDFGLKTSGKFHLKVAIKMLKKYKKKFGINKIISEDVATVKCNETEFPLSSYMLLTKGYTFYGKEGFEYVNKDYNNLLKKYKNYILKLKVKDVDIKDMLKNSKNKKLNSDVRDKAKDNKNMLFVDFLGLLFSRENMLNDEKCELYMIILDKMVIYYANKLGEKYYRIFMTNLKMEMKL
jgi:hypothetical protein